MHESERSSTALIAPLPLKLTALRATRPGTLGDVIPAPELSVLAQRAVRQTSEAMATVGASVLKRLEAPEAGSPRADDLAWLDSQESGGEELKSIAAYGTTDVAGLLLSAYEHVQGLELVLFGEDMLPIPALSLARAAQEACILFCYTIDTDVPTAMRLARVAALRIHAAQENVRTLELFGDAATPEMTQNAADGWNGFRGYFERAGLELTLDGRGKYVTAVTCEGHKAPLSPKTTDLSKLYIPAAHNAWTIGSGATHSRTWLTQGLAGPWGPTTAGIVFPLLDVADALAAAMGRYVGEDTERSRRAIHTRRIGLMRGLGHTGATVSWSDYVQRHEQPAAD